MTEWMPATAGELRLWRDEGLTLPVWLRDDDAIAPTPALDRLLALAGRYDAPMHLAVIPEPATSALTDRLKGADCVFVLAHGWTHANHAPPDEKKAEFGPHRPLGIMRDEIAKGRERLKTMFGEQALPIFTPPWNRIAPEIVQELAELDFKTLSTFTPRKAKFAVLGVLQVNTHLDPVAWKSGGGLVDPAILDAQMARQLEARRKGLADGAEPYGILTHHLVQDDVTWAFIETLLDILATSGVARWASPLDEAY